MTVPRERQKTSFAMSVATQDDIGFAIPEDVKRIVDEVRAYVDEDVLPAEREIGPIEALDIQWEVVQRLRARARDRGIFVPQMPPEYGGLGLGAIGLALVAQECGVSTLASIGLNAMAPDEGNMHVLLHAATPEQAERWLRPLAEGRLRSCFLMTEPDVASSDPLNLTTTAVRDGDEWVINGRKSFATGAVGAAFGIVVARTGPPELRGPRLLADRRPERCARLACDPRADGDRRRVSRRPSHGRARERPRAAANLLGEEGGGVQPRTGPTRHGPPRPRHALDRSQPARARSHRPRACSSASRSGLAWPITRCSRRSSPTARWTCMRRG